MTKTDVYDVLLYHLDKQEHFKKEWKVFVINRNLAKQQDRNLWQRIRHKNLNKYKQHKKMAQTMMEVYNNVQETNENTI